MSVMLSVDELRRIKNGFDIIGNDAVFNTALEYAYKVASVDITTLIIGESGVGKDVIPKIIHTFSRRRQKPYIAVNCGAIAEGIVDSELFGHVKGAYTGATETRKGYFEEANEGTLFLDEIAELPLPTQAKLLRVLQSGEYIKVGSSKVEKCDVRVIAATNVNLESAVRNGKFREDLYYRLNAALIYVPPLRDRGNDIHLLFRKFLSDFSERNRSSRIRLADDAVQMLNSYRWPGNIRELKNVADRLSAFESTPNVRDEQIINAAVLSKYLKGMGGLVPIGSVSSSSDSGINSEKIDMIVRSLYQLKSEVDALKSYVYGNKDGVVATTPILPGPYGNASYEKDDVHREYGIEVEPVSGNQIELTQDERKTLEDQNIEMILDALKRNNGNRRKAASELGISERTLYRKLKQFEKQDNA